jgi:hypothetical protein
MRLLDRLDAENIPLKTFLAVMGMRNPQHNLRGLALFADEEQQIEACDRLAGHYLRLPTRKSVEELVAELSLVSRWSQYRRAGRSGTLEEIRLAWRALTGLAEKLSLPINEAAIWEHVKKIKTEYKDALDWCAAHDTEAQEELSERDWTPPQDGPDRPAPAEAELQPEPVQQPVQPALPMLNQKSCAICGGAFDAGVSNKKLCDSCRVLRQAQARAASRDKRMPEPLRQRPVPEPVQGDEESEQPAPEPVRHCEDCRALMPQASRRLRCAACWTERRKRQFQAKDAKRTEHGKARFDDLKVRGICTYCAECPAVSGRRMCDPCRMALNAERVRKKAEKKAAGICRVCTAPVEQGRSYCRPHLDQMALRGREKRAAREAAAIKPEVTQ